MNKYERIPERVIDLHGHSVRKSEALLEELLLTEEVSHLRIIVGKGTHSEKGAVLREFVKGFLNERNIRFSQSKLRDGGEGALEVFLS
jgi:DNA-nicking Smr family endonuclease